MEDWIEQCRIWCKQAKFLAEEIEWHPRDNRVRCHRGSSALLDASRTSIPGLTFEGEAERRGFGLYQKYAVMHRQGTQVHRVLMLEVYPHFKRSHVDLEKEIYGPHIHIGDERKPGQSHAVRQVLCNLDPSLLAGWIERFRRHATIRDIPGRSLAQPFIDDLFA
ncbi:hypothetical protein [Luteibacter aegosomatissinici]|uniref:hypothetical protein n=1 Tax=Luteibacter aegosomatissinici TaxID=2911539 RepID=UPI001FF75AD0|nr:hypothetical protein [Luteibacter aegosomatissinici]UPG96334.1 hypothetical protein L2Y97_09560 [Luteibacter aegosomatissinici]